MNQGRSWNCHLQMIGWLLLSGMAVCASVSAQIEFGNPDQLGFDVETLKEIDEAMNAGVKEGRMVGANAMILKDDKVCYYGEWGLQNREEMKPVQRDTIWRIYSMSKPITSVAVMQLVEQGKLELDKPVSSYIPELADLKVLEEKDGEFVEQTPPREMTVRDLLRHTSGLSYGLFGNTEVDKRYRRAGILLTNPDLESMVTKLGELPLKHAPGERFEYSVSTDVLGYLVEVASGQRFDRYLKEHLFEPLAMTDTSFMVPEEKRERFADLFRPGTGGNLELSPARSSARYLNPDNRFFSGGGGLCSTIDDYMQFCRMLLNKGQLNGHRVLSESSIDQMWTNQLGDLNRRARLFRFGLGFSISPEGDYSWGGAAGTRFWVNPDKNLAIVFMVQINPYRESFGKTMREIVYEALEE